MTDVHMAHGTTGTIDTATTEQAVDLAGALRAVRDNNPLVQCLTNIVVANFTANVLLSAGASPAMVDNSHEAADFAAIAGGVLINTGTPYPETAKAMLLAAESAATHHNPWVLDPVAAGLPWRTDVARNALAAGDPAIIRGNASEIIALAGSSSGGRGTDSTDPVTAALATAKQLARTYHCAVAISGPVDHITDGERVLTVSNGHEWMTRVTGVGCSLGALMAAFAAVVPNPVDAATAATALLCVAADHAAAESRAPGSFATALVDQLYLVSPEQLATEADVRALAA